MLCPAALGLVTAFLSPPLYSLFLSDHQMLTPSTNYQEPPGTTHFNPEPLSFFPPEAWLLIVYSAHFHAPPLYHDVGVDTDFKISL